MTKKYFQLEYIFLVLAIIMGTFVVLVTPPMCSPDENAHFVNSYAISTGDMYPDVNGGYAGRYLPENIYNFVNEYNAKAAGDTTQKFSYTEMAMLSYSVNQGSGNLMFYQSQATGITPLAYVIPSTAIIIGRGLLSVINSGYCTPYNLLLFARFSNLIIYITLIFFAIRITPKLKNAMFMIALMPMSIFLGASVNYDSLMISVTMFLFAVLIRILCGGKEYVVTVRDIVYVGICTFVLVGIKQLYAPFLILLFAVPMICFRDWKKYLKIIGIVAGVAVVAYIPQIVLGWKLQDVVAGANQVAAAEQKEYLFSHLGNVPSILYNTFIMNRGYYISSFIGSLGNLDTNFPLPLISMFGLSLFFVTIYDVCNVSFSNYKVRLLSLGATLIAVLGSCYMLYVSWTCIPEIAGVGANYISGLQGRYYIPMFLFAVLMVSNNLVKRIKLDSYEWVVKRISVISICIMNISMVLILFTRFW